MLLRHSHPASQGLSNRCGAAPLSLSHSHAYSAHIPGLNAGYSTAHHRHPPNNPRYLSTSATSADATFLSSLPSDTQAMMSDFQEALREFRDLQQHLEALGLVPPHAHVEQQLLSSDGQGAHATPASPSTAHPLAMETLARPASPVPGPAAPPASPLSPQHTAMLRQYNELKRRLMFEGPQLRGRIDEAGASIGKVKARRTQPHSPGSSARSCNKDADAPRVNAVSQWFLAKGYRRTTQQAAATHASQASQPAASLPDVLSQLPSSASAALGDHTPLPASLVQAAGSVVSSHSTGSLPAAIPPAHVHALGSDAVDTRQLQGVTGAASAGGASGSEEGSNGMAEHADAAALAEQAQRAGAGSRGQGRLEVAAEANSRLRAAAFAAAKYRQLKTEQPQQPQQQLQQQAQQQQQTVEGGVAEVQRASHDVNAGRANRAANGNAEFLVCP